MEYRNLSEDPDWGHKPDDDNFIIDKRDFDDMCKLSIKWENDGIPYYKHFERGYNYYTSKFYNEALDEFLAGYEDRECPKCATMIGTIIADKLLDHSRSTVSSFKILSLGDNPIPYLQKGVSARLPEAMAALAIVYVTPGKYYDERKSLSLMKQAAKLGHPLAISAIEEYQRSRPSLFNSLKFGFSKATIEGISEFICESTGNFVEATLKRLFFS